MDGFILGIIQGIAEWLPISSEGVIFLTALTFIQGITAAEALRLALWLHLGTFLAALLYFRGAVSLLVKELMNWKQAAEEAKNVWIFLFIATSLSGIIGVTLLKGADIVLTRLTEGKTLFGYDVTLSAIIIAVIGFLLLITGFVQYFTRREGRKEEGDLTIADGIILGIMQGFSVLPGLSRSGLTIAALLLRRFEKQTALQLSFLLSLPIVLGGNIIINMDKTFISQGAILGLISSFLFGYLTIDGLMRVAGSVRFGTLVILFGVLTIASLFIYIYVQTSVA